MNTKLMLIGGIIVLLALGAYMFSRTSGTEEALTESGSEMEQMDGLNETEDTFTQTGPFADVIARGEDVRCTFTSNDEQGSSEGTFYFSDGMYRVEAVADYDGAHYESKIIGGGGQIHMWSTTPEGDVALVMPEESATVDEDSMSDEEMYGGGTFDMEADVDYDCAPWQADAALFVPPSDIEFMNMEAMFESMFSGQLPEGMEGFEGMEGMDMMEYLQ